MTRHFSTSIGVCATVCHVTHRNITRRPLTDLQQAILDFIWSNGQGTAEQVREALRPRHKLKDSSIRTLLRRLEQRGFLRHRLEGQLYVYQAVVRPHKVAARAVRHIIEKFCAGSTEQFLLGMVDERILTADELRKLATKVSRR
jgi:BlaI family penicillinase repressor